MKRLLSSMLAGISVLSLVACGSAGTETETDVATASATTEAETTSYIETLPKKNYDGATVTILTLDAYNEHFKLKCDLSGEVLNDAGYQRNLAVSELLNVNFEVVEVPSPPATFKESIMAGDTTYDMIFPHCQVGVPSMVTDGLLYDLNTLPYVDFTNPWWNQAMTESLGIGKKLFYCSGDIVMTWQGMNTIVFNKEYLSEMKLKKDLYQTVFDGEWTLDCMADVIKDVAVDLNGDGVMNENDRYGLLENRGVGYGYMYAADQRITTPDKDGYPELAMNTERMVNIVEKYYKLIYSGETYVEGYSSTTFADSVFRKIMMEGRSFLTNLDVGGLYTYLRDIEFEFGLLPLPKYDENQEDYRVFCGAGLIGVPVNAKDAEMTGIVLETMGYYSYVYIRPAFFDIVLENKCVRDENSYKVLQLMHENKVFDFGFNFDSTGIGYGMLKKIVIDNQSTDFASTYAANENALKSGYQAIVDACKAK